MKVPQYNPGRENSISSLLIPSPKNPRWDQISLPHLEQNIDKVSANIALISHGKTEHQMSG